MGLFSSQKIRLGVTGLARSGKTVFLTSLIHQLLRDDEVLKALQSQSFRSSHLPFLDVLHQDRLMHVSLNPRPHSRLQPFRYERYVRSLLSSQPEWPESTQDVTHLGLRLHFVSRSGWQRTVFGENILNLEIVDYPGEWLLDLPLLSLDYSQWSALTLNLFEERHRRERAVSWLRLVDSTNGSLTNDAKLQLSLCEEFQQALLALKYDGYSFLQPGRCVLPKEFMRENPQYFFCPLPWREGCDSSSSLYQAMRTNYDRYCAEVVAPFYRQTAANLDRQVVLVDLLECLNRGPDHFFDTQEALKTVLRHFHYGSKGWFNWFSHNIDKVLFVVTKLDHVGPMQAGNCCSLLEDLLEDAARMIGMKGTAVHTQAIASIVSSHFVESQVEGKIYQQVVGKEGKDPRPIRIYPGEVPAAMPTGREWQQLQELAKRGESFCFPAFNPPVLDTRHIPHINLDRVIQFLLGDCLA